VLPPRLNSLSCDKIITDRTISAPTQLGVAHLWSPLVSQPPLLPGPPKRERPVLAWEQRDLVAQVSWAATSLDRYYLVDLVPLQLWVHPVQGFVRGVCTGARLDVLLSFENPERALALWHWDTRVIRVVPPVKASGIGVTPRIDLQDLDPPRPQLRLRRAVPLQQVHALAATDLSEPRRLRVSIAATRTRRPAQLRVDELVAASGLTAETRRTQREAVSSERSAGSCQ